MLFLLHAFLCLFTLLPLSASAEGTVQDLWIFPEAPDFTSEITTGTTIQIRWHSDLEQVFAYFCTQCYTGNVDLWLTGTSFAEQIAAGVNVSSTFSYSWDVKLNESIVNASPDWSFRFLPSGAIWNGTGGQEISSAQFSMILPPESSSTTMTTTTTTSTSTSTSSTTTSTATSSPTPSPTPDHDSDGGLSAGAKAGIGIGAAAAGILIIALIIFFVRRIRRLGNPIPPYDVNHDTHAHGQYQPAPGYATPSSRSVDVHEVSNGAYDPIASGFKGVPTELASEYRAEMDGGGEHGDGRGATQARFELDASK
ncbi:hypothetical protein BJY01DRAFT_246680 [Aspergillus pseudoustus]|uniref:Mid2 domain-containing protein n=1 Tax=Aspergillus pseudoustus TaxID=1810923 RepID=A0ABR4K641_9EURO